MSETVSETFANDAGGRAHRQVLRQMRPSTEVMCRRGDPWNCLSGEIRAILLLTWARASLGLSPLAYIGLFKWESPPAIKKAGLLEAQSYTEQRARENENEGSTCIFFVLRQES